MDSCSMTGFNTVTVVNEPDQTVSFSAIGVFVLVLLCILESCTLFIFVRKY